MGVSGGWFRRVAAVGTVLTLGLSVSAVPGGAGAANDRRPGPDGTTVRVMSFNLWHGGTSVEDGPAKQAAFIESSGADLVGVQESDGTAARDLARELGWNHVQSKDGGSAGIVSRFPILETFRLSAGLAVGARVRIAPGREAVIWSTHLNYQPYGPYDACFGGMTEKRLLQRERDARRPQQLRRVLRAMKDQLAESRTTPVFLTGDFNAPSHLDWVPRTAGRHCGYRRVAWPTSKAVQKAGLIDSFRTAHPDPRTHPGITWSPIFPTFTGGYGYDEHAGEPEPQDRIDYVHYAGRLTVQRSRRLVVGDPAPYPEHEGNAWASDHAAMMSTFGYG